MWEKTDITHPSRPRSCSYATAVVLTLFLQVPRTSVYGKSPLDAAKDAIAALGPVADGYLADLRQANEKDRITVRVRMHNGDPLLNGCGFYFRADGEAGSTDREFFPRYQRRDCGGDAYRMRMTVPGETYDARLRLGAGDRPKRVELHADGWHDTFVKVLCVGFGGGGGGGGARAICVNSGLLSACERLRAGERRNDSADDTGAGSDDIVMTRTTRGAHRIVFSDIGTLTGEFGRIDRRDRGDDTAVHSICDRIGLVDGDYNAVRGREQYSNTCPAEKRTASVTRSSSRGNFEYKYEEKNPYGCSTPEQ